MQRLAHGSAIECIVLVLLHSETILRYAGIGEIANAFAFLRQQKLLFPILVLLTVLYFQ